MQGCVKRVLSIPQEETNIGIRVAVECLIHVGSQLYRESEIMDISPYFYLCYSYCLRSVNFF